MSGLLIMAALSRCPDACFIVDPACRISAWNPAAGRLFGHADTEIIGQPVARLSPPADAPHSAARYREALAGVEGPARESLGLARDGRLFHVSVSLTPLSSPGGEITGVLAMVRDTMAQKQIEAAFREREVRLAAIVNHSPSALSLKTPAGIYALANPNLQKIHGVAEDRIVGRSDFDLYPEAIARAFHDNDQQVLRTLARHSIEEQVPVDGGLRTYMSHIFPVLDDDGAVQFICRISLDITDRKRAEDELQRYRLHLEELVESRTRELSLAKVAAENASRAKSIFLANMSHEIRTPLSVVIGQTWLLQQRRDLDPALRGDLEQIGTAAGLLLHLVDDILDISKIEAGEIRFENAPFQLDRLLVGLDSLLRPQAIAKGLRLEIGTLPPGAGAEVLGDSTRTRQILLNLLNNAIKFTDSGEVGLAVTLLDPAADGRQRLRFQVRDSGCGIAPEALGQLFRPFQQADSSITPKYGGTGLGLTVVRQLCEAMGGTVDVDSTPGVGSCFTVVLPFRIAPVAAGSMAPAAPLDPDRLWLKDVRILLVDDSVMNLRIAGRMLELQGARVSVARNGADALDWLQRPGNVADAVLMDVQMPGMDGNTAVRRIRAIEALKALPVIALTAGALASEREHSLAAGMNDYLTKPFEPERMVLSLRRHIEAATGQSVRVVAR